MKYDLAREYYEHLIRLEDGTGRRLNDQDESSVDDDRIYLMENPTKNLAKRMYERCITIWMKMYFEKFHYLPMVYNIAEESGYAHETDDGGWEVL